MKNTTFFFFVVGHFYLKVITFRFSTAYLLLRMAGDVITRREPTVKGWPTAQEVWIMIFGLICLLLTIFTPLYFLL